MQAFGPLDDLPAFFSRRRERHLRRRMASSAYAHAVNRGPEGVDGLVAVLRNNVESWG